MNGKHKFPEGVHYTHSARCMHVKCIRQTKELKIEGSRKLKKERERERKRRKVSRNKSPNGILFVHYLLDVQRDSYSLFDICKINKSYVNCEQFMSSMAERPQSKRCAQNTTSKQESERAPSSYVFERKLAFHRYPIIIFLNIWNESSCFSLVFQTGKKRKNCDFAATTLTTEVKREREIAKRDARGNERTNT